MLHRTRPSWYEPDAGLAARMVLTMFLLGLVYVVFAVILRYALGVSWIGLGVVAVGIAAVQLFFADKIALATMRARIVSEEEAPQLHDLVNRLAAQANLPAPRVAVIESAVPNAFATGRSKNRAVIAVTTALLAQLSPRELEAVLAHELTHIVNRDMVVMTVATFFAMVAAVLMRSLAWGGGGWGRDNDNAGVAVAVALLVSVVTYALSFLLIRALSRERELAADRGSALITGAPEQLASALIHIDEQVRGPNAARIPEKDLRRVQAVSALCIMPAVRRASASTLFSTHPSLQQRLDHLHQMQRQMERTPAA